MKKILLLILPIILIIALMWTLRGVQEQEFTFTNLMAKLQNINLNDEFTDIQKFWQSLGSWDTSIYFAPTGNGFTDFFANIGNFFMSLGQWFSNLGNFIYSIIKLLIETIANAIQILMLLLGF